MNRILCPNIANIGVDSHSRPGDAHHIIIHKIRAAEIGRSLSDSDRARSGRAGFRIVEVGRVLPVGQGQVGQTELGPLRRIGYPFNTCGRADPGEYFLAGGQYQIVTNGGYEEMAFKIQAGVIFKALEKRPQAQCVMFKFIPTVWVVVQSSSTTASRST